MIISKTPYRISLFGGSTDYESFYSQHKSFLIGFAIDKYCYISVKYTPKIFDYLSKISYSKVEIIKDNNNIQHNGVRGVLKYTNNLKFGYEISCTADLPAQTGIGSSSSFIVGLLNCILQNIHPYELAQMAIQVERTVLEEPGGIQDQIWAAYGGINSIQIGTVGQFTVQPIPISEEFKEEFISRCIMIYTGKTRKSYKIAKSHENIKAKKYKLQILDLAFQAYEAFQKEQINTIGKLLHQSWEHKKQISDLISTHKVNKIYQELQNDGMIGGKLLGSGGSGFIVGILKDSINKKTVENKYKKHYVDINISKKGSVIINE